MRPLTTIRSCPFLLIPVLTILVLTEMVGCSGAPTPPASPRAATSALPVESVPPTERDASAVATPGTVAPETTATPASQTFESAGRDDRQALASLKKLGATVDMAATNRAWKVDFTRTKAQNDDLDLLRSFDQLEILTLTGTRIGDAGLEKLSGLRHLRNIELDATNITDAGLEHFRR